MFNKDTAEIFVDDSIRLTFKNSSEEQVSNFYTVFESLYTGGYKNPQTIADRNVARAFDFENNKETVGRTAGNYPISAVYAEYFFRFATKHSITGNIDEELPEDTQSTVDVLSIAMNKDAENIEEKIGELEDLFEAAGGFSHESGPHDKQASMDMFLMCKNNEVVKYIVMLCGKFKRIYEGIKRTTPGKNQEIPDSYILSGEISNILPEYFAYLSDGGEEDKELSESLESVFWHDFANEALMSQKFISKEEQGCGDFHMFVDYSGSMSMAMPFQLDGLNGMYNNRLNWAYALAAAIVYMVRQENKNKRKILVTMFAETCETFDATDMSLEEFVTAILQYRGGMGTNPNPALFKFANDALASEFNKYDGFLISDGSFVLMPQTVQLLNQAAEQRSLGMFGIYLDCKINSQLDAVFPGQSMEITRALSIGNKNVAHDVSKEIVRNMLHRTRGT